MTTLERLREQFGKTVPDRTTFTNTNVWYRDAYALLDLAEAVQAWREAACSAPASMAGDLPFCCDGENHLAECAVELARQGVVNASQKLETP